MTETLMTTTLIGYARGSTDQQDRAAQQQALLDLGVPEDHIYTDQALAAVRQGDTMVAPKLDKMFFNNLATFTEFEADPGKWYNYCRQVT